MRTEVRIYSTAEQLAEKYASELVQKIREAKTADKSVYILLPGGNTPACLFRAIALQRGGGISWNHVHLFWGDERCVPPDHPESNYGMAKKILLAYINIPDSNIHRIHAGEDPGSEARRYTGELFTVPLSRGGMPVFDLVLLGIGEDGHTASIFPDRMDLLSSGEVCEISVHPVTGQQRITVTGSVINCASRVVFLATGKGKAKVVAEILERAGTAKHYPAAYIAPVTGELTWLLDTESAMLIKEKEHVENK